MTVLSNIITPSNVLTTTNTATVTNKTLTSPTVTGMVVSDGTANGVTYLNGSKVLTSGSSFTYNNGLTVNGITQAYNTTLYTVDGTLSNYSATNGVYLAGNAAGWLNLAGDGTNASFIRIYGASYATPNIIQFNTASSEKMRLDASGNLGIGTSSPTFAAGGGIQNKNATFASFRATGGTSTGIDFAQGSDAKGYVYNRDNADIIFGTNSAERMRILSSGEVGIGTSSPTQPLTVQADSSAEAIAIIGRVSSSASRLDFQNNANTTRLFAIGVSDTAVDLYADANIPMVFATNNAERARIPAAGGLLVGSTSTNGSVSNIATVLGGVFKSFDGSVSAATNTYTTLFTAPTGNGSYIVTVFLGVNDVNNYQSVVIVSTQGGSSTKVNVLVSSGLLAFQMSGYSLQATQNSGAPQNINYYAIRIAN